MLLKSALLVVHAVDRDQRPVLVHCSDGWDRTPQIVALAKLLLDPYYRTTEVCKPALSARYLQSLGPFLRQSVYKLFQVYPLAKALMLVGVYQQ